MYDLDRGSQNFDRVFHRSLTIRGILWSTGDEQVQALKTFIPDVSKLILDGKIIYKEHKYEGLRNADEALLAVHTGANMGKVVIVLADD